MCFFIIIFLLYIIWWFYHPGVRCPLYGLWKLAAVSKNKKELDIQKNMQDYGWRWLWAVESHSERNAALLAGGLVRGLVREFLQQRKAVHGKIHRLWRRSCQTKHRQTIWAWFIWFLNHICSSCKENSVYCSWIIFMNNLLYFCKWRVCNDSVFNV